MLKRQKSGRITAPEATVVDALTGFADTSGHYIESSLLILDATDKSVIKAATLENCTVEFKEMRYGTLTPASTINWIYSTATLAVFGLQLDRSISLVIDLTAHNTGATPQVLIEMRRDGGATAHTLTVTNANGVVAWVGLTTPPDFSDMPADGSVDIHFSAEGGDIATIIATRSVV